MFKIFKALKVLNHILEWVERRRKVGYIDALDALTLAAELDKILGFNIAIKRYDV